MTAACMLSFQFWTSTITSKLPQLYVNIQNYTIVWIGCMQGMVRLAYTAWMLAAFGYFTNFFVISLMFLSAHGSGVTDWFFAAIFAMAGIPCSFIFWCVPPLWWAYVFMPKNSNILLRISNFSLNVVNCERNAHMHGYFTNVLDTEIELDNMFHKTVSVVAYISTSSIRMTTLPRCRYSTLYNAAMIPPAQASGARHSWAFIKFFIHFAFHIGMCLW